MLRWCLPGATVTAAHEQRESLVPPDGAQVAPPAAADPPAAPPLPEAVVAALAALAPLASRREQMEKAALLLQAATHEAMKLASPAGMAVHLEPWPLRGKYCCFLSHYKMEAATEARLVQFKLEKMMRQPVFIDSDNLKDLRQLKEHVKNSDVLVLFLTRGYFTRPWCLIEIWTAIEEGVPIVALNVRGGHPYDYEEAHRFLERLEESLPATNPGATELLLQQGVDPTQAAFKMASELPGIIATELSVSASRNVLNAQLLDLCEAMRAATPLDKSGDREAWLAQRKHKYGRSIEAEYRSRSSSCISPLGSSPSALPKALEHLSSVPKPQGTPAASEASFNSRVGSATRARFAVGYSSSRNPEIAVLNAYRMLVTKLSNLAPSVILVAHSVLFDGNEIGRHLRQLVHLTTIFFGCGTMYGVMVDAKWCSDDGYFVALQGVYDPSGIYKTFSAELPPYEVTPAIDGTSQTDDKEKEKVVDKEAKEACSKCLKQGNLDPRSWLGDVHAPPGLLFLFVAGANHEGVLRSVHEVIGANVPTVGGGVKSLLHSPDEGTIKCHTSGCCGMMCWPSVEVIGAFCHGLSPVPNCQGKISVGLDGNTISEINNQPAQQVLREWLPSLAENLLKEHLERNPDMKYARHGIVDCWQPMTFWRATRALDDAGEYYGVGTLEECGSWRVVMPRYISARDGSVTFAQQVHVGQTVGLLKGRLEHVQDQTARSCSEVMRSSGLQHPLASFSFICATYYGISGEHGMSMMAEKLSEALGWIPSLGIVGGPEFGTTASSTVTGGFTTSSIIFGAELNGLDESNAFMHVS